MNKRAFVAFSFALSLSLLSFAPFSFASSQPPKKQLEVMFYNVENLFDDQHDFDDVEKVEKNDWEFLPFAEPRKHEECDKIENAYYRKKCAEVDWTRQKIELKLNQIADVITKERPTLPNILGLCEVENENVVKMLAKKLGYRQYRVTNSRDERGIDVALLFNEQEDLQYTETKAYRMSTGMFKSNPSRDILEVEFLVEGKYPLSVFVNHWPSQASPAITRVQVAKLVHDVVEQKLKANPEHRMIIMGDFNTVSTDHPNAFDEVFLNAKKGLLADIHSTFWSRPEISPEKKKTMPAGTYYYGKKKQWNVLDRMFVSKNFLNAEEKSNALPSAGKEFVAMLESYEIFAPDFIRAPYVDDSSFESASAFRGGSHSNAVKAPKRYNFHTQNPQEAGYSDHFPIVMKFKF